MAKAFKLLIILVNSLLSLIYVLFSYRLWQELNNWHDWRFQSTWTPFYIYSHRIPSESTVLMPNPSPMLNFPFIIFCAIIVTNFVMLATYFFFIPRLQRLASQDI